MDIWTFKRSPQLIFLLTLVHALALIGCLIANIPILFQTLVSLVIFGSLIYYLQHFFWQAKVMSLRFSKATGFQLNIDERFYSQITILASTVVTPWVIILRIELLQSKIISFVIFNDGIEQKGGYQGLCRQIILNS